MRAILFLHKLIALDGFTGCQFGTVSDLKKSQVVIDKIQFPISSQRLKASVDENKMNTVNTLCMNIYLRIRSYCRANVCCYRCQIEAIKMYENTVFSNHSFERSMQFLLKEKHVRI